MYYVKSKLWSSRNISTLCTKEKATIFFCVKFIYIVDAATSSGILKAKQKLGVKAMPPSLSELKVLPSFCFQNP